ncbi:MAG: DOMON domain-containing protein [Spirochaetota bacterium]
MTRRNATVGLVLATIALALVLAGCGDDAPNADTAEAADGPEAEAQMVQMEAEAPFATTEAIGMELGWRVVGDELEVRVSGPTSGWVAVGFKPSRAMADANILMGYVNGSDVVMTDQFGTSMSTHQPDDELGGRSDVEVVSGSETSRTTTITFRIPLDSGDEYDQPLAAGETVRVILAYGPNNADDVRTYHVNRTGLEITL